MSTTWYTKYYPSLTNRNKFFTIRARACSCMLTDQDYDRGYITEVDFYKRFPTCRDQEIYEDAAIVETMESFIGPHEFIPVRIKRSIVGFIPFKNAKLLA